MLVPTRGLSARQLSAIAELEARCLAVDGGRLKLEWGVLRSRDCTAVTDALWWDGDELAGFVGVYAFGGASPEVTGMVDPARRRQGIGSALLSAALDLCADRGDPSALLVVPRSPEAGGLLARSRGGALDHSEHALELLEPSFVAPADDRRVTLRGRIPADDATVARLLEAAFGWREPTPDTPAAQELAERDRAETWLVVADGRTVGTMRLSHADDGVGVYGFAVDPAVQGRGIGRRALAAACRSAFADGATRVHLEVAVDNERALGLYTSLGFTPLATEDYYRLATGR